MTWNGNEWNICHANSLDTWDMSSPFEALQQIAATAIKKIHGFCSIAMCHFFPTSTHIHQCKGGHTNSNLSVHTDFIRFHLRSLCSFAPGDALLGALLFPQWYKKTDHCAGESTVRVWQSLTPWDSQKMPTQNGSYIRHISWHLPHNELWSLGNSWDLKKMGTLRTLRTPIFTSFYNYFTSMFFR